MIAFTLFAMTLMTIATLGILCTVATRDSALMPATVNPFVGSGAGSIDAAADTLAMGCTSANTLAGDWQTAEVATLREVEDVLDWLENHKVGHTDLTNHDGKFQIRWR